MKLNQGRLFVAAAIPVVLAPVSLVIACGQTTTTLTMLSLKTDLTLTLDEAQKEPLQYFNDQNKLATLIVAKKDEIFVNPPNQLSVEQIVILDGIQVDAQGQLSFKLKIKASPESAQNILETTPVILKGFNPTNASPNFALKATEQIALSGLENQDPKTYKTVESLKKLIFEKRTEIFDDVPANLQADQIEVLQDSIKIRSGALMATIQINDVTATNLPLINYSDIFLTGFKPVLAFKDAAITLKNVEMKLSSEYDNEAKLKQLIVAQQERIFDNLPTEKLNEDQIELNNIKNEPGIITVTLSVNAKNPATGVLVEAETIVLTGFKIGPAKKVETTAKPTIEAEKLKLAGLKVNEADAKIDQKWVAINLSSLVNGDHEVTQVEHISSLTKEKPANQATSLIIKFKIAAKHYYDNNGALAANESNEFSVTITGLTANS